MLKDLLAAALVGTRGGVARVSEMPPEIADTLPEAGKIDGDGSLLDAISVVELYERAGVKPRDTILLPDRSAADENRPCSQRAAEMLAQLLEDPAKPLFAEWLSLALRTRQRVPHRLLPRVLAAAASRRELRELSLQVVDRRGRWLAQFNPAWQYADVDPAVGADDWKEASRNQRVVILRAVREAAAAQARDLVASTWQTDAADERALWLELFAIGLSQEDEAFLEFCLDDRSSKVRQSAADLLTRLPDSALVRRMIDRVAPLVSFVPGRGGLLRLKRAADVLDFSLPGEFDKSMLRDGLREKPPQGVGPKQFWLSQIIGCVPLDYWTGTLQQPADAIVTALNATFSEAVLPGWLTALARSPRTDWVLPLAAAKGDVQLHVDVLRAIPEGQRAGILTALIEGGLRGSAPLASLLEAWRPLDGSSTVLGYDLSRVMVERYDVVDLRRDQACYFLDPRTLDRLEAMLTAVGLDSDQVRPQTESALAAIAWRRDIHRELNGEQATNR